MLLTHVRAPFNYYVVLPTSALLYWLFVRSITHYSNFFKIFRRGMKSVKSKIVNNLCKDMIYTFCVTVLRIWKPNGA